MGLLFGQQVETTATCCLIFTGQPEPCPLTSTTTTGVAPETTGVLTTSTPTTTTTTGPGGNGGDDGRPLLPGVILGVIALVCCCCAMWFATIRRWDDRDEDGNLVLGARHPRRRPAAGGIDPSSVAIPMVELQSDAWDTDTLAGHGKAS